MKDIGYSGQYLDNKEFRLKFRTGGDILNATGDAIAGEILVQTGVSSAVYIATETSTLDTSSIFKIADLTEKVGAAPAAPASVTPAEYQVLESSYSDTTKPFILDVEIIELNNTFGVPTECAKITVLDKRTDIDGADISYKAAGEGSTSWIDGGSLGAPGTQSEPEWEYTKEGNVYTAIFSEGVPAYVPTPTDVVVDFRNGGIIGYESDRVTIDSLYTLGEKYKYPYTEYTLSDGTVIAAADKFKVISTSVATSAILDTFVFEKSLDFKTPLNQNRSSTGLPLFIGPQHTYDNGGDGLLEGVNSQSWLEPVSFDSTNQTAVYKLRGVEYRPNTSPTYLPYAYGGLSEEFTIDFSDLVFFSNPSFPIAGFDLQEVVS